MRKWVVYGESTETGYEYQMAGPFDDVDDAQEALNQLEWKERLEPPDYTYYLGQIDVYDYTD